MAREQSKADAETIKEAKERFERCQEWYGDANKRFLDDYKFANGDSDNLWQWPDAFKTSLAKSNTPMLTINKTRQHNLQIVNDAKQNKPSVRVRPTGNGATFQSAQMYEGIVRHIEYQSNAQAIYDMATNFQVQGGVGYWRIVTDYIDEMSFDQEIFLRPILDPLGVFLDPSCKTPDKSDAEFGFIFEDMPLEVFERDYPQFKDIATSATLNNGGDNWLSKDAVRRCEYYRKVIKDDTLLMLSDGQIKLQSTIPDPIRRDLLADPETKKRKTTVTVMEWKYIVGDTIVEDNIWLGDQVPIIEIIGEQTIIDGKYDRKGHTRALKDPQRMYNAWSSAAVKYGALQTKIPWVGPLKAFENLEKIWQEANRVDYAYLPYNHMDDNAQPLPPPQRVEPPQAAPVALSGMQIAMTEMMMASGQYESQMGEQGNERTGKAINERQRQGDNATYHYIDGLALGIRRTGKILIDLIPKVYDTERIIMIFAESGETMQLKIDPAAQQAYMMEQLQDLQTAQHILNPSVGKYEVQSDIGPGYATKRQEAFDAFTLILTQAPQLAAILADILFKAGDFPMADEAAARLKRMVPPQALGAGPTDNEQQLQQQIEQMKGVMTSMLNELAQKELAAQDKARNADIGEYKAITERAKVALDSVTSTMQIRAVVQEMVQEMLLERQQQANGNARSASDDGSVLGGAVPETTASLDARVGERTAGVPGAM